ncbi:MAG: sulfotransferase [Gammaproteobacteria bacterium]|nr:sulfotransferase [Gammaproteobacteria bacterium]
MNPAAVAASLFEQASQAYAQGRHAQAAQLARHLLQQSPQHTGAWFLLGSVLLDDGRADEALPCLQTAARLEPAHPGILRALGTAHFNRQQWQEAARQFDLALRHGPADAGLLNNFGVTLKELGDSEAAIAIYRQALQLEPNDARIHNNLALALNREHDYAAAIEAYKRSTQLDPRNAAVWINLATLLEQTNRLDETEEVLAHALQLDPHSARLALVAAKCLRRRGDTESAIARLQGALNQPTLNKELQRNLEFELGRNFDLQGDSDEAYRHFVLGNRLTLEAWPELADGARAYLAELDNLLDICTPAWLRALARIPAAHQGSQTAFLVSFPRSGTTLMDTFLDAHPSVQVLEEEPCLELVLERVRALPAGYPQGIAALGAAQLAELRALYLNAVNKLAQLQPDMLVVDKNPFHSTHAAFIQRLLPDTRFIFALRHPCDVVLSCFMQPFGRNPVLANFLDLETTAQVYRRVMDLWLRYRDALPLEVHELRYEQLVADTRSSLQALLEFLGLPWSEELADHTAHAQRRGRIYTPSYHQVIRPVYSDAVNRWQRYQRHFGAVLDLLRPYAENFGYSI